MDYTKELKHVSLCAGYGGIDLGLRRALGAVRTVAFSEIEAFAAENLVAKIESGLLDECPIYTDLKTFPWKLYRGRVDILSGGFPCQPFSSAGRRAGDSDPRHLFPYITKGIRSLGHPPIVFFENVEGIITSKLTGSEWADPEGTPVLLHVLRELERMGYEATAGVFSASEVGAPHQRKRVFIMGCRADLSSEGRGIVDQLLRGTERGQELGSCSRWSVQSSCGRGRSKEGRAQEQDRESSAEELAYPESPRGQRERRTVGQEAAQTEREDDGAESYCSSSTAYPAPRGAEQYPWEPPRVTVGNAPSKRLEGSAGESVQGQTKPSMGGDSDGLAGGMVYAELCHAVDNRTDELRLLGNGVVPATAEQAFRVLWEDVRAR